MSQPNAVTKSTVTKKNDYALGMTSEPEYAFQNGMGSHLTEWLRLSRQETSWSISPMLKARRCGGLIWGGRGVKRKASMGFVLDTERGYWAKNEQSVEDKDDSDPMSARTVRVIPYVEDYRNCLLFEPVTPVAPEIMASLQACAKTCHSSPVPTGRQ
jgi:hypothetical protein